MPFVLVSECRAFTPGTSTLTGLVSFFEASQGEAGTRSNPVAPTDLSKTSAMLSIAEAFSFEPGLALAGQVGVICNNYSRSAYG